jgi:6-phosphogluconolactonase
LLIEVGGCTLSVGREFKMARWLNGNLRGNPSFLCGGRMASKIGPFERTRRRVLAAILCVMLVALVAPFSQNEKVSASTAQPQNCFVYIGGYTDTPVKGNGIYRYRYDAKTGILSPIAVAAELPNPSFIITDPRHRNVYAISDTCGDFVSGDFVSSYSIDPKTGALRLLNKVSSTRGLPCHLVIDPTGKTLFVAVYGNGRVVFFALKPDGSIGEQIGLGQDSGTSINPQRQDGPHVHETILSPDSRFLFTPDLGIDQIKIYKVDLADGNFTPNDPPSVSLSPGMGPRHFIFGPGAKFAYAICEMGSSVVAFSYDSAKGSLKPIQTISTLPADFKGQSTAAEITVDKSGRYLYASNRGDDSIAVFQIGAGTRLLKKIQSVSTQGKTPRFIIIDPTGRHLLAADQGSDKIVPFAINPNAGQLTPSGRVASAPAPTVILFVPAEVS